MLFLLFHLALLAVDAWALWRLFRRRTPGALATGVLAVNVAILVLAFAGMLTQEDSRRFGSKFTLIGLVAAGLFVHGPVMLVSAGILLRREARCWSRACLAAAAALVLVGVDAWFVEPTWLEVTYHRVESAKLARPLRIVVLADIQTEAVGEYERRVIRTALDQEPDLIVFPGDYIQLFSLEECAVELRRLNELLREEQCRPPLGLLAVEGNVETGGWPVIFDGLDALTFARTTTVQREGVWMTGLSFRDSFDTSLAVEGRDGFHLVVGHAPDFALGDVEADLLIAGHTHGGQVRIPFFGPPLTLSAVPRAWAAGRTELDGGRTLVVSRGIGLEGGRAPRIRFFCRPEIAVIDVVPPALPASASSR